MNVRTGNSGSARAGRTAFGLAIVLVSALFGASGCVSANASATPQGSAVTISPDPLAQATATPNTGPAGSVLTQRGDNTRLGWDAGETRLTDASVSGGGFGKRIGYPVDGKVYAQPLYVPGLTVDGQRHDVVFVATEHDSVYAFDADADAETSAGNGIPAPLWQVSLLSPGARTFQAATDRIATHRLCDSITPEVGVTSTPVIDWANRTMYVLALDVEAGTLTYRLHALSLTTGQDIRPSTVVRASVAGTGMDAHNGSVAFTASDEQQRMGLTLDDGIVYAGFSSWCGLSPYHGWVLGFRAADLSRAIVYNSTPDADEGGLWESESGITEDAHGHLFLVTGNGPFDLNTGGSSVGDSVLEMAPQGGTLKIVDEFTPFDQLCRYQHDQDLGSGSPLAVPGHDEFILSSKTGAVYVLDAAKLGGYTPLANACRQRGRTDVDKVKQELTVNSVPGGMWGTWGYWHADAGEFVYGSGASGKPTQWRLDADGTIAPTPVAQAPIAFSYPGAVPVVSSDGGAAGSGIVWTIDQTDGATLRAFDAADISDQLWSSAGNPGRDRLDDTNGFDHFDVPTVADGLVFVGDQSHLEIYGLLR